MKYAIKNVRKCNVEKAPKAKRFLRKSSKSCKSELTVFGENYVQKQSGEKSKKSLCIYKSPNGKIIEFSSLFEFGELGYSFDLPYTKKRGKSKKFKILLTVLSSKIVCFFSKIKVKSKENLKNLKENIKSKIKNGKNRKNRLPLYSGALLGAFTVTFFSFSFILYSLILKDYFTGYKTFEVPNFIGLEYSENEKPQGMENFLTKVDYKYSDTAKEGEIISQTPRGGTARKFYKNRELNTLLLTVSLGKQSFTMADFSNMSLRDATLYLKNSGVKFSVKEFYSDSVKKGQIISVSPKSGDTVYSDQTVIFNVSLGKKLNYVLVPDLTGVSEIRAENLIKNSKLKQGKINYVNSPLKKGTVISQSPAPFTSVLEGSYISLDVSLGEDFEVKSVPDLYGLTVEEARKTLSFSGLILGNVYAVADGGEKGRIIAQSPLPQTPVSSDILSVDIYVSS